MYKNFTIWVDNCTNGAINKFLVQLVQFEKTYNICYTLTMSEQNIRRHIMALNHKKTETINARIEPRVKYKAEKILNKLGLSNAEAIRLFYKQICLRQGMPFEIKIPNKETLAAIKEIEMGKAHKVDSLDDLFKD